jgi:hypothetical protein
MFGPLALFLSLTPANAYVWPNPQLDILESLRFDLDNGFLPGFVQPCNDFSFSLVPINGNLSGRSNAADWIRTVWYSHPFLT